MFTRKEQDTRGIAGVIFALDGAVLDSMSIRDRTAAILLKIGT